MNSQNMNILCDLSMKMFDLYCRRVTCFAEEWLVLQKYDLFCRSMTCFVDVWLVFSHVWLVFSHVWLVFQCDMCFSVTCVSVWHVFQCDMCFSVTCVFRCVTCVSVWLVFSDVWLVFSDVWLHWVWVPGRAGWGHQGDLGTCDEPEACGHGAGRVALRQGAPVDRQPFSTSSQLFSSTLQLVINTSCIVIAFCPYMKWTFCELFFNLNKIFFV